MRRSKGEGTIRQLPNGRWEAARTIDGKRVSRSGATRQEARDRLADATSGGTVAVGTKTNTVADALDVYRVRLDSRVQAGRIKPSTREFYAHMMTLAPIDWRLDRVKPSDIEQWQTSLGHVSGRTRRGAFLVLRSAFELARRDGLTTNDPFAGLEAPSGAAEREVDFASEDDVQEILNAAPEPWRTLWLLIAYTGLRRGEALALTWFDIDLDARELRVREGKTARARRTVPLAEPVVDALRRTPRVASRVFPFDGRNALRAFKRHAPRPTLTIHSLRHGFVTRMLRAGVPAYQVSALAGHSSTSITTDIYAHSVSEAERAAIDAVFGA